ncbi:MAG TPA: hypothetical protein VJB57_17065 [Dehalococcoidia bacterium]|nr:hypothetical protein [Dehalococcoidia bacterium]
MNLTIGNSKVNTRSNSKTRFVVAAAGLALGVSAAAALTPWSSGSTGKPAAVSPAAVPAQAEAAASRQVVYYLVGSQPEAVALQSAISSERAVYGNEVALEFKTVVVNTPEDEFLAAEMARELMQFAPQIQVVDTRSN